MKSVVFKIRRQVINPVPLRKMSLNALQREEKTLIALIKSAREANEKGFEVLKARREALAEEAIQTACKELGAEVLNDAQSDAVLTKTLSEAPQIRPSQDYVVRKQLLDLLALRLKLCRVEITRCKAQRSR